jgi:hypothetical protein
MTITREIKLLTGCRESEARDIQVMLFALFGFDLGKMKVSSIQKIAKRLLSDLHRNFQNN